MIAWAFVATTLTIVGVVVTLFVSLYPRVMVSNPDFANSLTIENASSADYTLKVMTVVAAILLPDRPSLPGVERTTSFAPVSRERRRAARPTCSGRKPVE